MPIIMQTTLLVLINNAFQSEKKKLSEFQREYLFTGEDVLFYCL